MSELVSPLIIGLVVGVLVALYGAVVPPLFGRPRAVTPVVDIILLALFVALLVFVLGKLGWAHFTLSM